MGRAGFDWRESLQWSPEIVSMAGDGARTAFTIFHSADSADRAATATQYRFQDALAQLPVSASSWWCMRWPVPRRSGWPEFAADWCAGDLPAGGKPASRRRLPGAGPVVAVHAHRAGRDVPGTPACFTHRRGWERWATVAMVGTLLRCLGTAGRWLCRARDHHRPRMIGGRHYRPGRCGVCDVAT
jgi:hypothetical protein